jgi:PHS family inorganic phosphate transporter-like MFS transporter
MATLYFAIGLKFNELNRISLLGLYGMTYFFSNYGPNSTTFMLPSMTFSRPCRSTLNGICAACGKTGALLGSYIFLPLASQLGDANVLILCGMVSMLSAILTFSYTEDVDSLVIKTKVGRTPSLAYLQELQVETFNDVPKTVSMPTFLDLNLH